MMMPTSIVCPVDFSPASLGGLHYALAIGRRFQVPVAGLTVVEPLLASIGEARVGERWAYSHYERELRELVASARQDYDVSYEVRIGEPEQPSRCCLPPATPVRGTSTS